ncbi:uncharacterized protein K02A2.6-like [Drosophila elegans]|uniref:uncharacterized protein K02A2.6-like n=1 Tax=Drosophila elegans TaxID=30023 RepID=UPI001BC840C2|nr:uncharacterized protein K02A2.6-like [Drosophila elegans]
MASDNSPQLTADAFEEFCKLHGIKHITTAPLHPASNGLAERFVQTFKFAVKKNLKDGIPLRVAVTKYLSSYRFTRNAQGKTPAEFIHGRPVRTVLSQLFEQPVEDKQTITKYISNQMVYARNYSRGEKWIEGITDRPVEKMLLIVRTSNGYIKRHFNQLKPNLSANNSLKRPPEFWWIPELPKPSFNQEIQQQDRPPTLPVVQQPDPVSVSRPPERAAKPTSSQGRNNLHEVFQAYQYAKAVVFARKSIVLSPRTSENLSI